MKNIKKRRIKGVLLGLLALVFPLAGRAENYFVATNGSDEAVGSFEAPFLTMQHAFDVAKPGDTIIARGGIYRETITLNATSGTSGFPITLTAYSNEVPILSGLDMYDDLVWTNHAPDIYVTSFADDEFEQLFFDGKPMLEARWPNVPLDGSNDWNFFLPDVWADVDARGNSYGVLRDEDLAATGWNISGSRVVLNVAHQFFCWTRTATNHSAGSSTFNYATNLGSSVDGKDETSAAQQFNDDRYYLVGELDYLDVPGEWHLDTESQLLYFYPPAGVDPNDGLVEIKTRDYGIFADQNSSFITVEGITFLGTAFQFGKSYSKKSSRIVFRNNTVLYSSWTEYFFMPSGDVNANRDRVSPVIHADDCVVENNTFAYGALGGLLINGFDNLIENNVFHDFDYSSTLRNPPLEVGRNWAVYVGTGGRATVRYNTLYNSGGILLQTGLQDNEVYQNHLYNMFLSCWGGNKDHAALYTQSTNAIGTRFHHNWVHDGATGDSPLPWGGGMAIRGDDKTAGLTVDHNVTWNIGGPGIVIKSPDNPTPREANASIHNTVFQDSSLLADPHSMMIVSGVNDRNIHSSVLNNIAEEICGGWNLKPAGPFAVYAHNATGSTTDVMLENTDWFDFRPPVHSAGLIDAGTNVVGITGPITGSAPDIGAYERGDSTYFIPGKRGAKATFPIVPDAARVSKGRDVLMWRPAYHAVSHTVYFGTSQSNLVKQGEFFGETNVFTLPELTGALTYYWRVDAVMPDASVVEGDVWQFSEE